MAQLVGRSAPLRAANSESPLRYPGYTRNMGRRRAWSRLLGCCWWVGLLACAGNDKPNAAHAGQPGAGSSAAGSGAGAGGRAADGGKGSAGRSAAAGAPAAGSGSAPLPGHAAKLGACPAFPADDAWNRDVSAAPVSAEWTAHLQKLVGKKQLHPDYGNSGTEHYGIPINLVPSSQAKQPIQFDAYPNESDPGPYPLPDPGQARIEGGTPEVCDGDCHLLVVQEGACRLYEGYGCLYHSDGWHCSNGAAWDLSRVSQGQRPAGYTSADAAGLPIAPGLVRYDEAQAGAIEHAIRFTLHCSRDNYVDPATHSAVPGGCSMQAADAPPMGLRVRLKANYDTSNLSGAALAVARAMQHYGMILADNGSDFYFQGELDTRWSEADVEPLKGIPSDAFEALEPGMLKSAH
jgi:hypothetical protein